MCEVKFAVPLISMYNMQFSLWHIWHWYYSLTLVWHQVFKGCRVNKSFCTQPQKLFKISSKLNKMDNTWVIFWISQENGTKMFQRNFQIPRHSQIQRSLPLTFEAWTEMQIFLIQHYNFLATLALSHFVNLFNYAFESLVKSYHKMGT